MSDAEEQSKKIIDEITAKTKRKVIISDEEREKRRERMINLRKKLAQTDEKKKINPKELINSKADEFKNELIKNGLPKPKAKAKADLPVKNDEDNIETTTKKPQHYATPTPITKKKPPVRKAIKIKYYGDVTREEMDYDAKMLENLHRVDKESDAKQTQPQSKKETPENTKMNNILRELGY